MPTNPSVIELSALDGSTGFRIDGVGVNSFSGRSVSSAGDVNGDGFADLIIGAPYADIGGSNEGFSYVVFGKESGFASSLDLSSLDGTDGFRIHGEFGDDRSGRSVANAGDVNGDGFDDVIIGAHFADPNSGKSGASWVVFGKASGFASNLELSALDGTDGFQINGEAASDESGYSVAGAGDVNGDGFDDVIVGARYADPNGSYSGGAYVIFGKASGFASNIELSTLDGSNGFQINGVWTIFGGERAGWSVASAGDLNGDGRDDLIIGAPKGDSPGIDSGASYVLFGKASGFASSLELSALDGSDGFRIVGETGGGESGRSVAGAGDVNGDGFNDLVIGAPYADPNGASSGASYVVFGRAGGFASTLNLSALNGANGFQINGEVADDRSGFSVAGAGDVNGDGFADLIIGAYRADPNGSQSGASYVVFGKSGEFASNVELSDLTGSNGFRINGGATSDRAGRAVASAGDLNGDGFDDLIIGAPYADPNVAGSGASYVIYGRATATLNRSGSDQADTLGGGDWDDTLSGLGGNDKLRSGSGADLVNGGADDDDIGGGAGDDTLLGGSGHDTILGGDGADNLAAAGGDDSLNGGADDDLIAGGSGNDTAVGGDGDDTLRGNGDDDTLSGGAGDDTLGGGSGNDLLDGGADYDRIGGGSGNDTILASTGRDTLNGGSGTDLLDVGANLSGTAVVDLAAGTASFAGGHSARLFDIENVLGTTAADAITGDGAANLLNGRNGNDTLAGAGGNDTLIGGAGSDGLDGGDDNDRLTGFGGNDTLDGGSGNDRLIGNAGADTFKFADDFGHDTVVGFAAWDLEDIDLSAVTAITDFTDLVNNHLFTDGGSGFALIDDLAGNTILLKGITVAEIGVGLDYGVKDFIF